MDLTFLFDIFYMLTISVVVFPGGAYSQEIV